MMGSKEKKTCCLLDATIEGERLECTIECSDLFPSGNEVQSFMAMAMATIKCPFAK
jgi:hypothetical protein